MIGHEGRARVVEGHAQAGLSHRAIGLGRSLRRIDAGEETRADEEVLLPCGIAQPVEPVLDAGRRRADDAADPAHQRIAVERGLAEGGVDDAVEHMRVKRRDLRQPRRAPEDLGEERQQRALRAQQRQQLDGGGHADEGVVEMGERPVGIGGAAERHQQGRRQFGQDLAGTRAGDGGAAAEMPAPHRLGRRPGLAEAELLQRLQRLRIEVRAGETQRSRLAGEARPLLEQERVMALDAAGMGCQRLAEGRRRGIAAEAGEGLEIGRRLRQRLRLLVMAHLQAMLDRPQPAIGLGQFVAGGGRDPALPRQLRQHLQRARAA